MICKCYKPEDTTYVNVTTDSGDGEKNKIDTIYLNSDGCCNYEEFEKLMKSHYFDVEFGVRGGWRYN